MDDEIMVLPEEVERERLTIRRLIPEAMLNELLQWRDTLTLGYWRIGDITNDLYALALANNLGDVRMDLYGAVAKVVGKSARSVRFYAGIASFFPPEVRQQYEVLPFSHFAFARQFPHKWKEILDLSMDISGESGVPPSVNRLEWEYKGDKQQAIEANHYGESAAGSEITAAVASVDVAPREVEVISAPENVPSAAAGFVASLSSLVTSVANLLANSANAFEGTPDTDFRELMLGAARFVAVSRNCQEKLKAKGLDWRWEKK